MSAIRLPVLCAFVGGCLSGAVLLGVWRADSGAAVPARLPRAQHRVLVEAASATRNADALREASADALRAPSAVAQAEPASAEAEAPASAGSAVSDVLTDLEAAYRRRLAAAAPAEGAATAPSAPPVAAVAQAPAEPPREIVAPAAAPALSVALATAAPAVATVAPVAVAAAAAPAIQPVATEPPAAPALAAPVGARPTEIHIGDINNTYVSNLRQGDVYLMQQQVALMQYVQLLGMAAPARYAGPARSARGTAPQYHQFPSTLTNPDNPWGFSFTPPNLVH